MDKLAYNVAELASACGLSKDTVYDAIRDGNIVASFAGPKNSKPLVLAAEAERWLASLPNVSGKAS